MDVFIDTWAWLAYGHKKDPYHELVLTCFHGLHEEQISLVTSDYVMNELITILFRREPFEAAKRFVSTIFESSESGLLTILRVTGQRFRSAWALREKFQDKPRISFTDFTSMAMMQELGITQVVTDDDHFMQVGMGFEKLP